MSLHNVVTLKVGEYDFCRVECIVLHDVVKHVTMVVPELLLVY